MASQPKSPPNKSLIPTPTTTAATTVAAATRVPAASSRGRKICLRKRGKLPTVRLGGGNNNNKKPRRGFSLVKIFRRARLKWLKLHYSNMLKKIKAYYKGLIKDIVEGGGAIDSFQQRLIMETSFAVPVMGLSFNSFPNHYGN